MPGLERPPRAAFDAIVLGAGAAGLMAAMVAGQRGRRVAIIDHAPEAGRKILISGGGRCNFTNIHCTPERFLSENPHFARSALARYTPRDFIALVERHRIPWHEKTLGQLFCDGSARAIVAMLLEECAGAGVELRLGAAVTGVSGGAGAGFCVTTTSGALTAPSLVIATGGPSIPKLGATGFAYELAAQFGLAVVPPRPALVPFTLGGASLDLARGLAGVAVKDAQAVTGFVRFREAVLFTHRGLSGPAILQVSSYWQEGREIALDFAPGQDLAAALFAAKRARPRQQLKTALAEWLPARLADALATHLSEVGAEQPLAAYADRALAAIGARLHDFRLTPAGTEGYAKAEVTVGGIDTAGLSSQSMAARAVPGLFCIGEALDVTGWLGGYNFQWAWASGAACGAAL